jgi:hypothetical protein
LTSPWSKTPSAITAAAADDQHALDDPRMPSSMFPPTIGVDDRKRH